MMTEFIGNIIPVEAGQIFVIVGKTLDAASRYDFYLFFFDIDHCITFSDYGKGKNTILHE